jgi:hypothetical protein
VRAGEGELEFRSGLIGLAMLVGRILRIFFLSLEGPEFSFFPFFLLGNFEVSLGRSYKLTCRSVQLNFYFLSNVKVTEMLKTIRVDNWLTKIDYDKKTNRFCSV